MDELSGMEKQILRYASHGIATDSGLSQELFAPWSAIEYALNKLIAAGLMRKELPFVYVLTDEGKKLVAASHLDEES